MEAEASTQRLRPRLPRKAGNSALRSTEMMIALGLLGYPLFGTLVAFTSLPSFAASVPIRAVVLLMSFFLIQASQKSVLADRNCQILFIFWSMYFVRLIWDLLIAGIPIASDFLFTFVFFCIIPAVALMHAPRINEQRLSRYLLILGSAVCTLAVVAANTELAGDRSTTVETGRLFLETVNPITYGHAGATTLFAALSLSRFAKGAVAWLGLTAAIALGAGTIQLAASRGPLVSLFLCLATLALANRRYRWLLIGMAVVGAWMFTGGTDESESLLASRVVASAQNDDPEIRILMQAGAIDQFLESPLVGSAILERQFQDYPHNPLIESAMAMGVPGLALMLTITGLAVFAVWQHFRTGALMVPLLVMQYIVAGQFSGNLAASAPFWMLVAYALTTRKSPKPQNIASARISTTAAI